MILKGTKHVLFVLVLAAVVWGCGNNSTGVGEGEPPQLPEITAAQPDFSYFEGSQKAVNEMQDEHAFTNAQYTASSAQFLFAFGQLGTTYFSMAENQDATFEDGKWVWNYSASFEGQTAEFRLTADVNESANEAKWEFYISASGGEQDIDNFKYMEGTTSLDGGSGNWKIYDFEGSTSEPVMSYEWSTDSDDNLSASFNFNSDDSFSSIDYAQEGVTHTLTLSGSGSNLEVYWDTDNDHGYWWDKTEDQKLCWTTGKNSIACSDIGL